MLPLARTQCFLCEQGRNEASEELYSNYQPSRVREGKDHPDPIVETSSLAGVTPPEPTYQHHLHVSYSVANPQLLVPKHVAEHTLLPAGLRLESADFQLSAGDHHLCLHAL